MEKLAAIGLVLSVGALGAIFAYVFYSMGWDAAVDRVVDDLAPLINKEDFNKAYPGVLDKAAKKDPLISEIEDAARQVSDASGISYDDALDIMEKLHNKIH